MLYSDLTLGSAAENLACDEAMLDACEEEGAPSLLRTWEAWERFVVVGYANRAAVEADLSECERAGVPVLRRCTGGGTVLQAPGCLNYSLILRISDHAHLNGIRSTNDYVMEKNRRAVERAAGLQIQREGHTDLAINLKKFCGNAQRRRKYCLIFHGCFLLDCDLPAMELLLRMPSHEPDYRRGRSHSRFVANLEVGVQRLKEALRKEWHADGVSTEAPVHRIERLVAEKYSRPEWNFKF